MGRTKSVKTKLNEFITKSMDVFGFTSKNDYLTQRASNNFVVLVEGAPLYWDDNNEDLMVLNTEALAREEANEYINAEVITEMELYTREGVVA